MGIMSKIVSLDEDDEYVNLLVYGKPGVGKTVFAGSADRVLFLAPEDDGTISAKRQGSKADKVPIKCWNDIAEAYDEIVTDMDKIKKKYDWIAVDSITHMQRLLMRQILDDAVAENAARDPDVPALQDWQVYYNKFSRFVESFNALPINVLWTGLVRSEQDTEKNDFLVPDIQGKGYQIALAIASFMTSYGYMETRKVPKKKDGEVVRGEDGKPLLRTVRLITWEDTGKITGKDRTDVLAPRTINKSLQQITDMIEGKA